MDVSLADVVLLTLVAFFVRFWFIYCFYPHQPPNTKKLPPGPPAWPLLGHLPQVLLHGRHFVFMMREMRRKHGPIFRLRLGQRELIVVTGAELIHEALVGRGHVFASRPADSPIRLLFSVEKCAINSAQYGPLWRCLRRNLAQEVLSPVKVSGWGKGREWAIRWLVRRLKEEATDKGRVMVAEHCRAAVCGILVLICFGKQVGEEEVKAIEGVLKEVMLMTSPKLPDFLPLLTPLFRRQMNRAKELRKRQLACLVPLVSERKAFLEGGGTRIPEEETPEGSAYVDSLFHLRPPGRGELKVEEMVTLCSEVINAGTDTSATTVEWALLHMVLDQRIQEKLYEEVVIIAGTRGPVTEAAVERMPYLTAVIKETLRRHPPSHFLLSHTPTETTELGGYRIRAGTYVEFYTAWMTEDPGVWEKPWEFKPERFLEGGEGVGVDMTGTKEARMLPFGAGRRICPAMALGTLHVSLLLARLVQAFLWLPSPECPPLLEETYAFTVVMKNPLQAVVTPRW